MKTILNIFFLVSCSSTLKLEIGPDNFLPDTDDVYISGSLLLDAHPRYYISDFQPRITPGRLHHFAVIACLKPGSNAPLWNSLDSAPKQKALPEGYPCENKEQHTLYAWSYNSSGVTLPKDVSYEVGIDAPYKYLVFEIHYPDVRAFSDGVGDSSKIVMEYTTERTKYGAGYMGVAPTFIMSILPGEHKHIDITARVPLDVHPLSYQVHTHGIGTKVSGYIVSGDSRDPSSTTWTRLGQRDPTLPQNYVPTETNKTLTPDDIYAVRCHYYNHRNYTVKFGSTDRDEMCNMYIIFWSTWEHQINNMLLEQLTKSTWKEYGLTNIPADA